MLTPATVLEGLVLGWSVAWPPGPINAEMVRRGLAHGFWSAWSLGLGASTGDFLWAVAVALGAGALAHLPGVETVLAVVSLMLLLVLAVGYLSVAWRGWRHLGSGVPTSAAPPLEGRRSGYLLGLTMAVASPWAIAFWLAVIGGRGSAHLGLGDSLLLATAVVVGANAWSLTLCGALRLGSRFATPSWDVGTRAATGLLMLAFAARQIWRLLA